MTARPMTEGERENPLPCPFCGSSAVRLSSTLKSHEYATGQWRTNKKASLRCSECQCQFPWFKSDEEAIAAWNCRRTSN